MKITEQEIPVNRLISVFDGVIRRRFGGQDGRLSDGFVFVLSGSAQYAFADRQFTACAGDVLYLARDDHYRITVTADPYRFICVNFDFAPTSEAQESDLYHVRSGKAVENAFVKLLNLWRVGDFSDKLLCKAIFYEIYAAITKAAALEDLSADRTHRLDTVIAYLNAHYTDPELTVEQLAAMYGTSTVHFRRTFARLYRTSPMKFITALRLSKARELLLNTELPVGEICRRCGYTSVYYFDRVFKKEFGMQPLQLRKHSL